MWTETDAFGNKTGVSGMEFTFRYTYNDGFITPAPDTFKETKRVPGDANTINKEDVYRNSNAALNCLNFSNGFKQKRSQALNYLITPIERSITTYQNIATLIRNHITH
ncbi:hypothetical protein [Bacillus salipaludis]|uniref:Uncharacterized protein n=1 Tax=Bacillus salipaludis TaxID=2547811 RepID=A0AA90TVW1_9BACI|nr:hypothetical protein [Bacillus salipaludis]MDQ6597928.1 hypothetical protein [Bacillus salipaludis]